MQPDPTTPRPPLDLDAIRERNEQFDAIWDTPPPGTSMHEVHMFSAALSADDIPALLAEVTALRAELDAARAELRTNEDSEDARLAIAENEVTRLRESVASARAYASHVQEQRNKALAERDAANAALADVARLLDEAREERDAARAALAELVRLKDGPRDEEYTAAKEAAWNVARQHAGGEGGGS